MLGEEKFKKFFWEMITVYLDIQKYVIEVQRENSRKFNYYAEWILDEKLLKSSRVWENDQHGKVVCLQ